MNIYLLWKKSAITDFRVVFGEVIVYTDGRKRSHVRIADLNKCNEVSIMAISYKKLWKLLIDRDMKKKDLCSVAGISHASVAKLGKNENVTTEVLLKICTALKCDISDIMEITDSEQN